MVQAVIDTKLEDNLASQEKIWVNLQQSISELEALGKDRTALVRSLVHTNPIRAVPMETCSEITAQSMLCALIVVASGAPPSHQ